jgi:hypothetical protein
MLVVCGAAFAVVVGAAFSGSGPRPAPPADEPSAIFGGLIPLPPGAWSVSPVADGMEVNGMPMQMAQFQVDLSPPEVIEFYAARFIEAGLELDGTPAQQDGGGLVAWDPEHGVQRTITVFRQGTGSAVFPALVALEAQPEAQRYDEPLPPGPTGARLVSDVVSRDGNQISRTISMVTELEAEASAADLRRRLELAGYAVSPIRSTPAGHLVEARDRRGRILTYTVAGAEDSLTGVAVVIREEGR